MTGIVRVRTRIGGFVSNVFANPVYAAPVISGDAPQTTAFLARTVGLDATHTNAYKALINGLVSDGVWAKLDALYMFATADATTALLSLVSATYNATNTGLTFTADQGYAAAGGPVGVDTNFNPSTAASPNFVRDSNTFFLWSNSSGQSGIAGGYINNAGGNSTYLIPRYTDDATHFVEQSGTGTTGSNVDGKGLYAGERVSSSHVDGYKNGSSIASNGSDSSIAIDNMDFSLGYGLGNAIPYTGVVLGGGFGSSMGATLQAALYARMHTYFQTISGIS